MRSWSTVVVNSLKLFLTVTCNNAVTRLIDGLWFEVWVVERRTTGGAGYIMRVSRTRTLVLISSVSFSFFGPVDLRNQVVC